MPDPIRTVELEFDPEVTVLQMRILSPNRALVQGQIFSPGQIPGLSLWLNADYGTYQNSTLVTAASADSDPLGGWLDVLSGNSLSAVQATAGARASLRTGSNGVGGKNAIQFNGTSQGLQVASLPNGTQKVSVAFYGITTADPVGVILETTANFGTNNGGWLSAWNDNVAHADAIGCRNVATQFNVWNTADEGAAPTAVHSFIGTIDTTQGASATVGYLNGIQSGARSLSASMNNETLVTAPLNIGARNNAASVFWGGKLRHVLVYNNTLTAAQALQLHNWMAAN